MKTFKYLVMNLLYTVLMVMGFVFENEGCRNVFTALVWVSLAGSILCCNTTAIGAIRAKGRYVSERTAFFIMSARFLFLAYFGAFYLATVYLFAALMGAFVRYWAFDHKPEVA